MKAIHTLQMLSKWKPQLYDPMANNAINTVENAIITTNDYKSKTLAQWIEDYQCGEQLSFVHLVLQKLPQVCIEITD